MSISGALSNARSGLTAAARAAEVVSANVANALTPGYGRRELELSSRTLAGKGNGVQIDGVVRRVDQATISQRRQAEAGLGNHSARADFYAKLEKAFGTGDKPSSLSGRITQLEAAIIQSTSRPDSDTRLQAVVAAARSLSQTMQEATKVIQSQRMKADRDIATQVSTLNDGLANVARLNHDIMIQLAAGHDATALMDQRQQKIDAISSIVPLREVPRDRGQVALYTTGGAILLDGSPARLSFAAAGVIVPQMTVASGALSRISIDGRILSTAPGGPLSGGSLSGLFAVRDELSVTAQRKLDALARDLLERFTAPATDPTLSATEPGLLTDAGARFSAANEVGLAGRIAVNPLVDNRQGGTPQRLRDGLGSAAVSANPGDATRLLALSNALSAPRTPASGGFSAARRTASGLASDVISFVSAERLSAEADQGFSRTLADELKAAELKEGVDTDHEMEQLLLVQQAFSANARVISTVNDLVQTLLRL